MINLSQKEIAEMHSGKIRMTRDGELWSADEKQKLIDGFYSGLGITELAYIHERTENAIIQQLVLNHCFEDSIKTRKKGKRKKQCLCENCGLQCSSECPIMQEKMKKEIENNV